MRLALSDTDTSVRHAAVHSSGLLRDAESTSLLILLLEEDTPPVQRAAAEALGRIGTAPAVSALLAAASNPSDRILEHSLVYALIEINDPAATARGLESTSPSTRRAALVALDQMDQGELKPEMILPYLTSSDPKLEQTAYWIAGNHPEWGGSLARFFERRLTQQTDGLLDSSAREELVSRLASFSSNVAIQQLLARLAAANSSGQLRQSALGAMAASEVKQMPAPWSSALVRCLDSGDPVLTAESVETARAIPPPDNPEALQAALLGVVQDQGQAPEVRIGALVALPNVLGKLEPELYALVLDGITIARPPALRALAASAIERADLGKDQLASLSELLARDVVGPMELPRVLAAFSNSRDEKLGLALMSALERSRSRSALRAEVLDPVLERFPEAVRERGRALLTSLDRDPEQQARKLEELMATLQGGEGGDIRRGQAVFNGPKGACSTCHAIGYVGGRLGPDLTRIGRIRTQRDLLEAIVYPDVSFVHGYEPIQVLTHDGERHSGVVREDTEDSLVLGIGADEEVQIDRSRIAELRPGTVSVMPSGLDQQLSTPELADLLAFLIATQHK